MGAETETEMEMGAGAEMGMAMGVGMGVRAKPGEQARAGRGTAMALGPAPRTNRDSPGYRLHLTLRHLRGLGLAAMERRGAGRPLGLADRIPAVGGTLVVVFHPAQ